MGRIKSAMVKKAAKQLIEKEGIKFNEDFENNKTLLRGLLPSKPIQNKVAGYISRLIKMQNIQKEKRKAPAVQSETATEVIQEEIVEVK
jgi:small subunit ribosomal protein S17e